ncbi:MAG: hypothetical protein JJT76_10885 [Clostridiaceae bacterium]|nr:hypothetical protein [Clostridiaceae bacterium]
MLIGLMEGLGRFYFFTWFIWPFIFVFSLVSAIASIQKYENASAKSSIIASISLMIILAGVSLSGF